MNKVLLVVHSLGYNGAPMYAYFVSGLLQKNNIHVTIWSYSDSIFKENFQQAGIDVKIIEHTKEYNMIIKEVVNYDYVLAFTILTYKMVAICKDIVPTIWYIHEGQNITEYIIQDELCYEVLKRTRNVWVVSEHAKEYLADHYGKTAKIIHNFVPDEFNKKSKLKVCENAPKKRFLLIGSMIEIKAFDVYFDAFLELEEDEKEACEFHYAGEQNDASSYVIENKNKIKRYNNVINHGVVTDREEMIALYNMCDVVVVPSRDESCSLVALEAAMMGKPIIVTENVGAKYLVTEECGWIIKTGDSHILAALCTDIINGKYNLDLMGKKAREQYLLYATEKQYEKQFFDEMSDIGKFHFLFLRKLICVIKCKIYCRYYKSPFTDVNIPRGSKIVLYGAGKNGTAWKKKLKNSRYCKVVAWVDKYHNSKKIFKIDKIPKLKFDYVAVTVRKPEIQKDIERELIQMGVKREKIIKLEYCKRGLYEIYFVG